jgi:dATP pyrophosphohydrolase
VTEILVRVIDAYVYCYEDNKLIFLLLKRSKTKIYERLWQGVAGKIEKNELAWQTALRELKEETGLKAHKMFVADYVSKFYEKHGDRINLVPVFGIEVKNKKVSLSDEHCNFKWLSFKKAYDKLTWSGQKKGLEVVHSMLNTKDARMKWSKII